MREFLFTLAGGSDAARAAFPLYSGEQTLNYDKPSGEQFFRPSLGEPLTFAGEDYTYILGKPFGTRFVLTLQEAGGTDIMQWEFYLTDCEVDADAQILSVTPAVVDGYGTVLDGAEKEFNLIDLKPEIAQVQFDKRAMIQIYRPGQTVIGCYLGGMWWEQPCDPVTSESRLTTTGNGKMNFARLARWHIVEVTYGGTFGIPEVFAGQVSNSNDYSLTLVNEAGRWTFRYFYAASSSGSRALWQITKSTGERWEYELINQVPPTLPATVTLQPVSSTGATGEVTLNIDTLSVFGRVVCDVPSIEGFDTYTLKGDDPFVTNERNYSRVRRYDWYSLPAIGLDLSATPTEWGQYEDGRYYVQPSGYMSLYPVARLGWGRVSVWYSPAVFEDDVEADARAPYTLRDAYPLYSVISVLLGAIGSTATHEGTAAYSEFLYGMNPIDNTQTRLLLTPKSNVINSNYDQPAQKAPVTLRSVLDMLRDCYRCYWWIDAQGRFRIEHISYFLNGGSYTDPPEPGRDLTTETVSRSGKAWAYGQNRYTFDKPDTVARYEFGWMDKQTAPFDGHPIDIISPYVEQGKIESVRLSQFSADIDYILLEPSEISSDGFVLLAAEYDNGYKLAYERVTFGTAIRPTLQNGRAAFAYLQRFYLYDLPAPEYKIGSDTGTALGVVRLKSQEVKFPCEISPDLQKLIKTGVGDGKIEKISINLSSRSAAATLKFEV